MREEEKIFAGVLFAPGDAELRAIKLRAHNLNTDYNATYEHEVEKRAAMAKKLAAKYNLPFVPLQAGFDALAQQAPASHWLRDGVHPSAAGHAYIAQQWQNTFAELMK